MTSTPFYQRLSAASPQAVKNIAQVAMGLCMAILAVEDASTCYDFAKAVDDMLSSLGVAGVAVDETDRPENYATSDRPLYLRLDDSQAGKAVRNFLQALNLNALYVPKGELRDEYNAAMRSFWTALGIPSVEELQANPDAYPRVHLGKLHEANEAAKRRSAEVDELEAIFGLDTTEQAS